MKKRRGFTLAEVAISLFLVGIVVVSVYATISSSIKLAAKDKIQYHALHEIENLVTCYSVIDSNAATGNTVQNALALYLSGTAALANTLDSLPSLNLYYDADGNIVSQENAAMWKISVTTVTSESDGRQNYLFTARYVANESEVIYEYAIPDCASETSQAE